MEKWLCISKVNQEQWTCKCLKWVLVVILITNAVMHFHYGLAILLRLKGARLTVKSGCCDFLVNRPSISCVQEQLDVVISSRRLMQ